MEKTKRAVILSGGELGEWALSRLREDDLLIAADRGAWFAVQHGLRPSMALGDFDSVDHDQLALIQTSSEAVEACDPVWKNATDTEMAVEYALQCGVQEILLLGATGTRLDHTLANIHLLAKADEHGVRASLADANNELHFISSRTGMLTIEAGDFTYVSLLPLNEQVTGITLQGFRYPLQDAVLTLGDTLGISNELLDEQGTVTIDSGRLLVFMSRD